MVLFVCGCSEVFMNIWDKTNTVVVQNRSGVDIPKVVVLEGRVPHTFNNLDQTSNSGHMFHVRKPTTVAFAVTVFFPDGQSVVTNATVSFDPKNLTETCIRIDSNRLINIQQRNK